MKRPPRPGLLLVATREIRFFRRDHAGLFLLLAIPLISFAVLAWTFSSGVVTLYTISSAPADGLNTVAVSAPGTYRYIRYVAPPGSYGNIAEFDVFGTA